LSVGRGWGKSHALELPAAAASRGHERGAHYKRPNEPSSRPCHKPSLEQACQFGCRSSETRLPRREYCRLRGLRLDCFGGGLSKEKPLKRCFS
jgi:hypothetical protein